MTQTRFFGRLLFADLSAGRCEFREMPPQALDWLGGRGFNVWYLYHHLPPDAAPLGPENLLIFSNGFLTGSAAPCAARLHVNALSPLTGILGSSNIGGHAGARIRSCNLSSIIISGMAAAPAYLYVSEEGADIRPAGDLWGLDAFETQEVLKNRYKTDKVRVLAIGRGGENRVRYASILSERDHAAGRTGMGAVMGAKQLKAVVIARGGFRQFPADTPEKKQAIKTYVSRIRNAGEFKFFSTYGSAGYIDWANELGVMSGKNYSEIGVDDTSAIDGRKLADRVVRPSGCFKCPVQCKAELTENATRPEFEPVMNFGPKCGLTDLPAIVRMDNLCSRLGIDTTSTASAIAFAMALREKGILPQNPDLSWGNADAMEGLIRDIAARRGLGDLLAKGVRAAAQTIGGNAADYAAHVKGLELTAYHPNGIMGTALGYAVSSRGGDYNNVYASLEYSWTPDQARSEFGTPEAVNIHSIRAKGQLIKKAVITNILVDSLGLCKVPVLSLLRSFNLESETDLINGLTGLSITRDELFRQGEAIAGLEKWFNIRHGKVTAEDDCLPDMFFSACADPSAGSGKGVLTRERFDTMLADYYQAMGWDAKGTPPKPGKYSKIEM